MKHWTSCIQLLLLLVHCVGTTIVCLCPGWYTVYALPPSVRVHYCCVALQLHPDKQRAIAEELDRNPGEVLKKIEDIRNKIL